MRRIFDELRTLLRQFLVQRDDLLLLVPCTDGDVALLLKALRDLDRESAGDVFLLFADDFRVPRGFLDAIAQRLQDEHRLANEASGPDVEKLPSLPPILMDSQSSPRARLEAGLGYAHSLIDSRQGQHFLWGMAPCSIDDAKSYLDLLSQLPPKDQILPWMRGARIVARVPADFDIESTPLAGAKRVRVKPFTVSPEAHHRELAETAADEKAPMGDRMQAEVQLAYLDVAYSRYGDAAARFLKSLAFFQWAEIPVMEGLIICGLGDIARRQKNLREAQHWYSCAVVPASSAGNPVLMAMIVQNLAAIAFEEERFSDAEDRYAELVTLKRSMLDEDGLAEALEWLGRSQEKNDGLDRALVSWEEAALICRSFELEDRHASVTKHLRRAFKKLGLRKELEAMDAEAREGRA